MNLCSEKHDEICFEGRDCPLCEMRGGKDGAISDMEDEIETLTEEIANLKAAAE